ncbi:MAG TPA: hypothetical protein VGN46_03610 [Luteibacter sp.]|jgi:hypothetical protein|uniref:hypothetical protein n=1 Tax=Luteibacter sp. TaxID=1886636 RepID=UPI002F3F0333
MKRSHILRNTSVLLFAATATAATMSTQAASLAACPASVSANGFPADCQLPIINGDFEQLPFDIRDGARTERELSQVDGWQFKGALTGIYEVGSQPWEELRFKNKLVGLKPDQGLSQSVRVTQVAPAAGGASPTYIVTFTAGTAYEADEGGRLRATLHGIQADGSTTKLWSEDVHVGESDATHSFHVAAGNALPASIRLEFTNRSDEVIGIDNVNLTQTFR